MQCNIKDLGKTVLQTAAPEKMQRLSEQFGFGISILNAKH